MSVEKYSLPTKTWSNVSRLHDRRNCFCACAFMHKIFIIEGNCNDDGDVATNSCLQFDTSDFSWKEVAAMKGVRSRAASAVFRAKIVVSG